MSQIRRRQLENKTGFVGADDYPDAFKAVFTEEAGTEHRIMSSDSIIRYILDGEETILSNPVEAVTPTTSGTHVLYFWLSTSDRLNNNVSMSYIRIPANPEYWHVTFIYTSWSLQRIDFIGTVPPTMGSNFGVRYGGYTMEVRIPIGTLSAYQAAFQDAASTMKNNINIIETNDFTYNI